MRDTDPASWAKACGSISELCTVMCAREKCASARVKSWCGVYTLRRIHGICYCLGPETARTNNTFFPEKNWYKTKHGIITHKLTLTTLNFSLTPAVSRGHSESEFDFVVLCHLSDHLSSCHPCECHVCQLWFQEDELHHVGLGDQLEDDDGCWRSEFCDSANCSAEWILNHSRYSCSAGWSLLYWRFLSLEYNEFVLFFLTCVDLPLLFSLPGTLVFAIMVLPACSRQDFVSRYIFLSAIAVHCGWCRIARCGPRTWPMRPTNFDKTEISCRSHHVAISPRCVSSLVVMLLPRVRTACTTSCDSHRCAVVWCLQDLESFFNPVHHVCVGPHQFFRTCGLKYPRIRDADMMDIESRISWTQWALHCPSRRQHGLILCWTPSCL